MSGSLVQRAVQHARLTVLLVAAILAGAAGGAWATGVAPSPVQVFTVADQQEAAADAEDAPDDRTPKADKPEKAEKPEQAAKPDRAARAEKASTTASSEGAQGVHGSCVSEVAKDKDAVGGRNDNHGGAVSKAAHDCPR